jgi:hypothetical protein
MSLQYGAVSTFSVEGWLTKTLRVDWTARTTVFQALLVFAAIGNSKTELYRSGVRYLKFPNNVGDYNIIDWETGTKTSVAERAPYYFDVTPPSSASDQIGRSKDLDAASRQVKEAVTRLEAQSCYSLRRLTCYRQDDNCTSRMTSDQCDSYIRTRDDCISHGWWPNICSVPTYENPYR